MKKKLLSTILVALVVFNGMTVTAAPIVTADGGVFDAEYYAQNNPDVVEVYGNDMNQLYLHFVTHGVNEGRLPFAPGTDYEAILAGKTADTTTVTATTETIAKVAKNTGGVNAVINQNYAIPVVNTKTLTTSYLNLQFKDEGFTDVDLGNHKADCEYKTISVDADGEWVSLGYPIAESREEGVNVWYWNVMLDGNRELDNYTEDSLLMHDFFDLNYNGVQYKELVMRRMLEWYDGAVRYHIQLPKDYKGATLSVYGSKLENGQIVKDEASAITVQIN